MNSKEENKDVEKLKKQLKEIISKGKMKATVFDEIIEVLNKNIMKEPYNNVRASLWRFIKYTSDEYRNFYDDTTNKLVLRDKQFKEVKEIDTSKYEEDFKEALKKITNFLNISRRPSTAESVGSNGGASSVKYNGRTYKIHIGKRGGKYILVGADKKKVYI